MPKAPPMPPKLAETLDRGFTMHKAGDLTGALAIYDSVLNQDPDQADALSLKATVLYQQGEAETALPLFEKATGIRPDDAVIWNDFGIALEDLGDLSRAIECFRRAIDIEPALASAHVNIARFSLKSADWSGALAAAELAVTADPSMPGAHNVKATALRELGTLDTALAESKAAINLDPANPEFLVNHGTIALAMDLYEAAALSFGDAVRQSAAGSVHWADAMVGLGLVQAAQQQLEGALEFYETVLENCSSHASALFNRAEVQGRRGLLDEALDGYQKCLEIDPDHASARHNLSLLHLLHQNWADGWQGYELRWGESMTSSTVRDHGLPRWNGPADADGTVLVWGEQGLGDQVLFLSILPSLIASQKSIVLEIDPRLVPLVKRKFPELRTFGYDAVPPDIAATCEFQMPLGSLGLNFRTKASDFPPPEPFLKVDPDRVEIFAKQYRALAEERLKVGIAWRSVHPTQGDVKSLPLKHWGEVLSSSNCWFVSLQYGDVKDEVKQSGFDDSIYIDSRLDPTKDLDGAAAQIASLDLIICTSGTAAHLAGALGKETWVMLPKVPEWRWGLEEETTPWYPNVRLFRQTAMNDWSLPVRAVSERLTQN